MDIRDKLINAIYKLVDENSDFNEMSQLLRENDDLACLNFNSIRFIKLIVDLENEFNIEFDDEALNYAKYTSLTALCEYVEAKIGVENLKNLH